MILPRVNEHLLLFKHSNYVNDLIWEIIQIDLEAAASNIPKSSELRRMIERHAIAAEGTKQARAARKHLGLGEFKEVVVSYERIYGAAAKAERTSFVRRILRAIGIPKASV